LPATTARARCDAFRCRRCRLRLFTKAHGFAPAGRSSYLTATPRRTRQP
jgi:hypothetical protein